MQTKPPAAPSVMRPDFLKPKKPPHSQKASAMMTAKKSAKSKRGNKMSAGIKTNNITKAVQMRVRSIGVFQKKLRFTVDFI